jgi:predicted RecA/RadA family phage recombinase
MRLGTTQAQDLRQGELVRWSASDNGVVRHVRDQAGFAGVTKESQVSNLWNLGNQPRYVPDPVLVSVFTSGIHEMLGTDGEEYAHGAEVYMGSDSQTITTDAGVGGVKIGKVWLPNLAPKSGAVRVPILIDDYTKNPV